MLFQNMLLRPGGVSRAKSVGQLLHVEISVTWLCSQCSLLQPAADLHSSPSQWCITGLEIYSNYLGIAN